MKKIIVLMTSVLLLTGCVKVSFTGPKNILRLVVKKSPTGESTHYFFFVLK